MAILNFTLTPEALGKFHDALVCLGKFSEAVSIEATNTKLILTALNSSKSAYASFTLIGSKFFSKYQYTPVRTLGQAPEKFSCKIYNKALLSVFKGRAVDPTREKDTAIDRCDVSIEDGDGKTKSRVIVKIVCRHGVLKTYRLTFESVAPMHALFAKEAANNRWSISSKTLREFVEHFGPGTEQLDIYSAEGRVSLTSFTEKIMSGNEVLKQPLHTTIAIDADEFVDFVVEEQLHIVISVKDFKSIITHAGITNTNVKALYSQPSYPMQLTYSEDGMLSEFILMTIGESRGTSATPAINGARASSKRPASKQPSEAASTSKRSRNTSEMPPPVTVGPSSTREAVKRKDSRPSPPPPTLHSQSLFFPEADDDRRWDPANYDDEDNEMLLWDANPNDAPAASHILQGIENQERAAQSARELARQETETSAHTTVPTQRLAPTQRLSQVRGIFD